MELKKEFMKEFGYEPTYQISAGGRFEILGNHTDHNHGLCCAATCNLSIHGFVKPRGDMNINYTSVEFGMTKLDLNDVTLRNDEKATSKGLIRGIARYLAEHGYKIGGFDCCTNSDIFLGAGVSSSAAFESLIGQIFNILFNDGKIDRLTLAKAGQYAENTDFGKKSGLLDQIGTGYGNIVYIDFKDINNPIVEKLEYPFKNLHFVIVNTGGSHAHLSELYSAIPMDMWNAAKKLGHDFLRDCDKQDAPTLIDIERNRAKHFFSECERVRQMKKCIQNKDEQGFIDLINGSRESSTKYLKNMMVENQYEGSPLEAADIAMKIMGNKGACKVNGGGFAGSIICVVPEDKFEEFMTTMKKKYGPENTCEVFVNPNGPIVEKL